MPIGPVGLNSAEIVLARVIFAKIISAYALHYNCTDLIAASGLSVSKTTLFQDVTKFVIFRS